MDIYEEIKAERIHQDAIWGGPEHDDEHEVHDWTGFIGDHKVAAFDAWTKCDGQEARRELIQVAALAVAAIESMDRKAEKLLCPATHANGVCVLPAGHRCDHRFESSAATEEGILLALEPWQPWPTAPEAAPVGEGRDTRRVCTCLGTCKAPDGLGPGWRCALGKAPVPETPPPPQDAARPECFCGELARIDRPCKVCETQEVANGRKD